MEVIQAILTEVRQQRAANGIANNLKLDAEIDAPGSIHARLAANQEAIERLGGVKLTIRQGTQAPYVLKLSIPLDRSRVLKENAELEKVIANSDRQLE